MIERKSNGAFLFNGKPVRNNLNTQYMRVFRAVFEITNGEGLAGYVEINRRIESYGEEQIVGYAEIKKRIQNGRKEFFNKTKVSELLPNGDKWFESERGSGLILRNPEIG